MDSLQYVGSCKRSAPPAAVDGGYLDALMSYGIDSGAVSPEDAARLGSEAYALVCGLCRRRTGGKSSSLPEAAVRRIYASLSYTVGQDLSRRAPEAAVAVLVRDGVDASRRRGRRVIERKLSRACFYCGRAQRHRPETDNETYVLTLMGAQRGFFRIYDPVFAADDRKIGCDYPTVLPVAGLFGIDHIEEYAKRIYFESLFCSSLDRFSLFSACEFHAPCSRHAVISLMGAAVEAMALGTVGVRVPEPELRASRADILRVFYARASVVGADRYIRAVTESVISAAEAAVSAAPADEFAIYPGDKAEFLDYARAAAKKTAPAILAVAGRCI